MEFPKLSIEICDAFFPSILCKIVYGILWVLLASLAVAFFYGIYLSLREREKKCPQCDGIMRIQTFDRSNIYADQGHIYRDHYWICKKNALHTEKIPEGELVV